MSSTIEIDQLRVGMFIHLDLGWWAHPFALSSFLVTSPDQIATIRGLGLKRLRWSPEKSREEDPAGEMTTTATQRWPTRPTGAGPGRCHGPQHRRATASPAGRVRPGALSAAAPTHCTGPRWRRSVPPTDCAPSNTVKRAGHGKRRPTWCAMPPSRPAPPPRA
ncbi:MAG: DUF3391 domain-containing protein [Ideonella sp.]|nr:DUF3391 domain-containing protein [Ideonella sp.]